MTEHQLYEQIAIYLQLQYPKVVYRFDLAADLKLTAGQAVKHKKLHPRRGYPDLFIAKPSKNYHGLFIEIKRDKTRIRKKNGEWANDHIAEQAAMMAELAVAGYCVGFAVGFDEVKRMIDQYLSVV